MIFDTSYTIRRGVPILDLNQNSNVSGTEKNVKFIPWVKFPKYT